MLSLLHKNHERISHPQPPRLYISRVRGPHKVPTSNPARRPARNRGGHIRNHPKARRSPPNRRTRMGVTCAGTHSAGSSTLEREIDSFSTPREVGCRAPRRESSSLPFLVACLSMESTPFVQCGRADKRLHFSALRGSSRTISDLVSGSINRNRRKHYRDVNI